MDRKIESTNPAMAHFFFSFTAFFSFFNVMHAHNELTTTNVCTIEFDLSLHDDKKEGKILRSIVGFEHTKV